MLSDFKSVSQLSIITIVSAIIAIIFDLIYLPNLIRRFYNMSYNIFWFRRDLRLKDNVGLFLPCLKKISLFHFSFLIQILLIIFQKMIPEYLYL